MDTTKIYIKAEELAETLQKSELYQEYKRCQKELLVDETFTSQFNAFQKKQEEFAEVSRYGTYHPDYQRVKKEYLDTKIILMDNALFKRFKRLEKEFETTIFQIEEALQAVVGITNKHKKSSLKFLY